MPARKVFVGNIYPTTKGGDVIVLEYKHCKHILVEFMDENKYQTITETSILTKGLLHNPFAKTHYGVGFMGVGSFGWSEKSLGGSKIYKAWTNMLERCYCPIRKARDASCTTSSCCDGWHNFQVFGNWYISQKGSDQDRWHLDKDLLGEGSKLYSPETCVLLPQKLNSAIVFINDGPTNKAGLPRGVGIHPETGQYMTSCTTYGDNRKPPSMYFNTAIDAFEWYRHKKEAHVKALATEYKDKIDTRAYERLMSFEVRSDF